MKLSLVPRNIALSLWISIMCLGMDCFSLFFRTNRSFRSWPTLKRETRQSFSKHRFWNLSFHLRRQVFTIYNDPLSMQLLTITATFHYNDHTFVNEDPLLTIWLMWTRISLSIMIFLFQLLYPVQLYLHMTLISLNFQSEIIIQIDKIEHLSFGKKTQSIPCTFLQCISVC